MAGRMMWFKKWLRGEGGGGGGGGGLFVKKARDNFEFVLIMLRC